MVHNMAPAYDNAQYEYVWISTSRIKGNYDINPFMWSGLFYHNFLDWTVSSNMVSS